MAGEREVGHVWAVNVTVDAWRILNHSWKLRHHGWGLLLLMMLALKVIPAVKGAMQGAALAQ